MGGFFSPGDPKAAVPGDLAGMRQQQIELLQQLLGFAPGSAGAGAPRGKALQLAGKGFPGLGIPTGSGGGTGGPAGGDPLTRLQQFFGQLGVPQTDLQRQSSAGISQFINQPAPEQRALDIALPGLQEILSRSGGPQFERDIAMANQQGGRFASGNAVLRGEALRHQ